MNWKTWAPLAIAIVLGVVAIKLGKGMISKNHAPAPIVLPTARTVMANADVPAGTMLKDVDVTIGQLPLNAVPVGVFTDINEVIGRVPQVPLVKGQTILDSLLAPKGEIVGLAQYIPKGMRAVTLEVNETSGVAGMLVPGCHVDLVATINGDDSKGVTAKTFVEDLKIVAVGKRYSNTQPEPDPNQPTSRAITLLATPKEVQTIELVTHMTAPRLVLRGNKDDARGGSAGVTLAQLRGKKSDDDQYVSSVNNIIIGTPTTNPARGDQPQSNARTYQVQVLRNGVETFVTMQLPPLPPSAPAPSPTTVPTVVEDPKGETPANTIIGDTKEPQDPQR